ncbi:biotin carboxylase N-terminal domain-containing protein [Streptomyces sp. PmtG]
MIRSVLVANRGEIACRVFRTCRVLGIGTVAVHSDADTDALHVREADEAVRLPGAAPADTYLRGELLVDAARATGADAVHPGYGFLSENPAFARAVLDAGLVWIGPPPEAIEAMASKTRAKQLLGLAPLAPGDVTEDDLPVLVKAAAGGGGRGMRVVRELAEMDAALTAARAEAASAFGDGEVFVEPYVEGGRHVEVQLVADAAGTVWPYGTRDCSLQRRHQKVIEEAPAPGLSDALVERLFGLATRAARAVGYRGAGTVEFLVAADGTPHFLEMNTRLQVEHPVTEAVCGIDLVALQIRVAEGHTLEGPPQLQGHAVEARLYAEDPAAGWAPQTGTLHRLSVPEGVRLDTGYADGDTVGVHYDPMLAKVIAHAPTREEALRKLAGALERTTVHGPATNRELLIRSLRHPEVTAGHMTTAFYDRHLADLTATDTGPETRYAPLAAALADACGRSRFGGWRNLRSQPQVKRYVDVDGSEHDARYAATRDGFAVDGARVLAAAPDRVVLETDGVRRAFTVSSYADGRVYVGNVALTPLPALPEPSARQEPGSLLAPMPGTVVRVAEGLAEGARVTAGQPLVWLEAMKMEHRVTAPASGTLTALHARPGEQVEVGALLAGGPGGRGRGTPSTRVHGSGTHVSGGSPSMSTVLETEEHTALRAAVAALGRRYGRAYLTRVVQDGGHPDELWADAAKLGYLGVNLPEEYGGGGGGIAELSLVLEELGAAGCPLLMLVVSPAICGTVIARFGTDEQKRTWLPGLADGSRTMAFGITEPDAGSNSHRITTTARRDGDDWLLTGRKVFISGVDIADATLIVGRTEDARTGRLKPCLFIVDRDAPGFTRRAIDMELKAAEKQFELVLDDVRLPADALVGDEDAGLLQLFAGLNPERIMTAAFALGMGRYALERAVAYAKDRQVWQTPIGAHQAIAHPLAQCHVDLELASLMTRKAACLYDAGDDLAAGEAANMAKLAAADACVKAVDQAVHTLGGNGLTAEFGLASLIVASRVARIAPVSREMILNYVSHQTLGLPKSY